jgi:subtilisin family serine protease
MGLGQSPVHGSQGRPSPSTGVDSADPHASTPSIDPILELLEAQSKRDLPAHSLFSRPGDAFDSQSVRVSLRFRRPPKAAMLADMQRVGVVFDRNELGGIPVLGTVARARVSWQVLAELSARPELVRIEALWLDSIEQPLEVTTELIGVPSARRRPLIEADGARTTIALIDTGIDVLHPFFFHADGGYYRWIDTDQNGVFDPGVDAVDLDDNGLVAHNETLRVLDATAIVDFSTREFENDDGLFQPSRDWLYADMNDDRRRNVGVEAGFNEETPAYGEAIFVGDDVDGDGKLERDEKLVRLKTSKIPIYVSDGETYVRGDNLIEAGEKAVAEAFHGSGSASVLVGGQPGFHTRVGVAPAADLLVYGLGTVLVDQTTVPLEYLERAVDDGADVVLDEWSNAV